MKRKIKWYYYLYGIGLVASGLSVGLINSYIENKVNNGLEELYELRNDYNLLEMNYDILEQQTLSLQSQVENLSLIELDLKDKIEQLDNIVLLLEEENYDKDMLIASLNQDILDLETSYLNQISLKDEEIKQYQNQVATLKKH